jgi:hypothetical protein
MILQLHGYPIVVDGIEKSAHEQHELVYVARLIRWVLLSESDWTQLLDAEMTSELRGEWAVFRRYLRNLPSVFPDLLGDTLEIIDPPSNAPATWVNLTPAVDWAQNHEHEH